MVLSVEDREYENPAGLLAEHEAILTAIRSARSRQRRRRGPLSHRGSGPAP